RPREGLALCRCQTRSASLMSALAGQRIFGPRPFRLPASTRIMTIKERLQLVLKGMCMGFADVVPGVSGGTMALVLGIYTQLILAIKSVDLRIVKPLVKAVKGA